MNIIKKPEYSPSNPRPGGKTLVDFEKLDLILGYSASITDCVEILNISKDALMRRIKEKTGQTFGQYREEKMAPTRMRLVQKAINLATKGDRIMLIFCLKNLCKWADKSEISVPEGQSAININITERPAPIDVVQNIVEIDED